MSMARLKRRRVAAAPLIRVAAAEESVVPKGRLVFGWHANIASRWLDPQRHDGTATPDNFIQVLRVALSENFRLKRYDHLALAEGFGLTCGGPSIERLLRRSAPRNDSAYDVNASAGKQSGWTAPRRQASHSQH